MRCLLIILLLLCTPSVLASPRVEFNDSSLVVSGLTPAGPVAYVSVSLESSRLLTSIVPRDGIALATREGAFQIEIGRRAALRSVWAVVDLSSGAWVIASPEGFISSVIDPSDRVGRARGVLPSREALEVERNELEILIARPGVGAWRLTAREGSSSDSDRTNDRVLLAGFASARSLGDSAEAPLSLQPGDVLIAIDPEDLSHFAFVLER